MRLLASLLLIATVLPAVADERDSGRVIAYREQNGVGTIRPDDGGKDLFFASGRDPKLRSLRIGSCVTYRIHNDEHGRPPRAVDVAIC